MNNNLYTTLLLCAAVFLSMIYPAFSQKTGSFNETISFNGEDRTVSFYVPQDYDPQNEYRLMVCLHGLKDNSSNFRNALIDSLSWNMYIPNTIFACPDGGNDQGRDFYSPAGDEQFIMETINYCKSEYNINEDNLIIEGFSLGGRSALKFGLDNPDLVDALLLNTPAIQGAWDALNHPQASLQFKYDNARDLKIAISQGANDGTYIAPVSLMYGKLLENSGFAYRQIVPNMGHSIAGQSYIQMCLDFIANPTPFELDAEIRDIVLPNRTCSGEIDAGVVVRNIGSKDITGLVLELQSEGATKDSAVDLSLKSYEIDTVFFKDVLLSENWNRFFASVTSVNGSNDENLQNDTLTENIFKITQGDGLPYNDGFEEFIDDGNDWMVNASGNISTWSLDNEVAKTGVNSLFTFNTILLFYSRGLTEKLTSPVIDLTTKPHPELSFDLAFNYHRYEPPVSTQMMEFTDTLVIYVSTDCGKTFEQVYRKAGAELATADEPILNAVEINDLFYIPDEDGWRREAVVLDDYADADKFVVRFDYISGMGGSINIDNVRIDEYDPSLVTERDNISAQGKQLSLYPNPAKESSVFSFVTDSPESISIRIYDALGNFVSGISEGIVHGENAVRINTADLSNGVYYINFSEGGSTYIKKLIVGK